ERIVEALSAAGGSSEIIVVDNDSRDKTRQIAGRFGAKVVSQNEHNISKVRNTGAKEASGRVLIFVDADTLIPNTLFQKIAGIMENDDCCGGAVAVEYGNFERKWMKFYLLGWKFWRTFFNTKQGATQFCRQSAFQELKGYNEDLYMG